MQTISAARASLGPLLAPDALRAGEQDPPPAPPDTRRRALTRVRAIATLPSLPPGGPGPHPRPVRAWPLAGLALSAAAGIALWAGTRPAPARGIALASTVEAAPRAAGHDLGLALARGLVGYWRFDDGRGSVVARDASGNANDCYL